MRPVWLCNLRRPRWIICRGVTGSAQSGPEACAPSLSVHQRVCGQWSAARSYPRKNAPGAGKPTGETPGESLVTGPRAGAVRLPEPVEVVSSDYHHALSAGGPFGGQRMRAKVIPWRLSARVLGETLPFGLGEPEANPKPKGKAGGSFCNPYPPVHAKDGEMGKDSPSFCSSRKAIACSGKAKRAPKNFAQSLALPNVGEGVLLGRLAQKGRNLRQRFVHHTGRRAFHLAGTASPQVHAA